MNVRYYNYLRSKKEAAKAPVEPIIAAPHRNSKPHQADCLKRLLKIGRGAAFLDTGLGKTFLQIDFARHIDGKVLIVAPLGVCHQTIREAKTLLGTTVKYSRDGSTEGSWITITNYDRLDNFDASEFECVILDESSILKGQNSKTKKRIVDMFKDTPYRLACTATPAPNDYTEIGNHAEFLGIMNTQEMLTRWFLHDSMNTGDWRLKRHAVADFWEWVSSWACCVSKPSDLGHSDEGYNLPELHTSTTVVNAPLQMADGMLFDIPDVSATSLHAEKKKTMQERCQIVADMVNGDDDPWIVWCESNDESAILAGLIPDAVEVKGSDKSESKEADLLAFSEGRARVIVSKPSICGFGMNWQHCNKIAFASISYSYEKFYQAIRRSWRFGQTREVYVFVVLADSELPVWRSIERKSTDHESMKSYMKLAMFTERDKEEVKVDYNPTHKASLPSWL